MKFSLFVAVALAGVATAAPAIDLAERQAGNGGSGISGGGLLGLGGGECKVARCDTRSTVADRTVFLYSFFAARCRSRWLP